MLPAFEKISKMVKDAQAEDDGAAKKRGQAILISFSMPHADAYNSAGSKDMGVDEEETTDDDSTQGECPQCHYKCGLLKFATEAGKSASEDSKREEEQEGEAG